MNTILAAILAQTNLPPIPPGPLHTSTSQLWVYAIAVVVPLAIEFVKWVVPTLPKVALPCLAPILGIALGFAFNAIEVANLSWVDGALLGGFGVTLREILDQAIRLRQSQETKAGGE